MGQGMNRLSKASVAGMLLAALALLGEATALAQATGTLELTLEGFQSTEGQAHVTLYADEESWLKVPKALQTQKVPIEGDTVKVKFEGLKPGSYAVSVIHDANKNDELDMRWFPFPKPKEGTGASRDPKTKMGPPKWQDANIELKAGENKALDIQVTYL